MTTNCTPDTRTSADPAGRPVRLVGALASIVAVSIIGGVYTVAEAVDRLCVRHVDAPRAALRLKTGHPPPAARRKHHLAA